MQDATPRFLHVGWRLGTTRPRSPSCRSSSSRPVTYGLSKCRQSLVRLPHQCVITRRDPNVPTLHPLHLELETALLNPPFPRPTSSRPCIRPSFQHIGFLRTRGPCLDEPSRCRGSSSVPDILTITDLGFLHTHGSSPCSNIKWGTTRDIRERPPSCLC